MNGACPRSRQKFAANDSALVPCGESPSSSGCRLADLPLARFERAAPTGAATIVPSNIMTIRVPQPSCSDAASPLPAPASRQMIMITLRIVGKQTWIVALRLP